MAASSNPDTFASVCHLASVPPYWMFDEHLMIYKDGDEVYVPDRFMALYAKLKLKYGTLLPHPDVDSDEYSNVYSVPKFRWQALLGILNLVYEITHTKENEFTRTLFESWMESAKNLQNLGIDVSWLTEKLELFQQVLVIREMDDNAAKLTEVEEELVRLNVEKQNLMCSVKEFEANLMRLNKEIQQAKDEKEVNMQKLKECSDMADKLKLSVLDGLL